MKADKTGASGTASEPSDATREAKPERGAFDAIGRHLHGLIAWPLFFLVSGCLILLTWPLQLLSLPFDPDRKLSLWLNHIFWGRLLWAIEPFWSLRRRDRRELGEAPCLIVCNHSSVLDIPAIMSLRRPIRVVGRESLFRVPLMGPTMRFTKQIALSATDPDSVSAFLSSCREALASGVSVLIFPEGTRSEDGAIQKFRRGAFRLSKDLGVPILPAVVDGNALILGKGSLWPQKTFVRTKLALLDEVDPGDFTTAKALSNQVQRMMKAALAEMRATA